LRQLNDSTGSGNMTKNVVQQKEGNNEVAQKGELKDGKEPSDKPTSKEEVVEDQQHEDKSSNSSG
jgi:hypothetical protein